MSKLTAATYPTLHIKPGPTDIMWIFAGKFSAIDNFAPTPVHVDVGFGPTLYKTSEHAFAAAKATYVAQHDGVRRQVDPGRAKAMGRKVVLRPDWEEVKFDMMWKILVAKFDQHPRARAVLESTGQRRIFEGNTWSDRVWGVTQADPTLWVGQNALGQQLMALRLNYFG